VVSSTTTTKHLIIKTTCELRVIVFATRTTVLKMSSSICRVAHICVDCLLLDERGRGYVRPMNAEEVKHNRLSVLQLQEE